MAAPVAKQSLKRKSPEMMVETGAPPAKKSSCGGAAGHWALGLTASMNDPELKVDEDEKVVIIKDKYPKARFHYLVIPKEHIASLKNLTRNHLPLLKHMQEAGEELTKKSCSDVTFLCGYHAVPSMSQLHMHVISDDFDSDCLKTKKHWNSFTTDYFVRSQDLMRLLEEKGSVSYDPKHHAELLKQSLRCHVCKKEMSTMPALKTHIKSHMKKS